MSETSTEEERTEMPTSRRMGELRKKGHLFISQEVVSLLAMVTAFLVMEHLWGWLYQSFQQLLTGALRLIERTEPFSITELHRGFLGILFLTVPPVLIQLFLVAGVAYLAVMLQTNWNVKEKKVEFKWPHLNPLNGIRNIFSISNYINVLKAILKLAVILPIAYFALEHWAPTMLTLLHQPPARILAVMGESIEDVFFRICYVLVPFALFDFFYGKHRWLKRNKMTKDEVKDERKAEEGDEATKRKIQNKGLMRIIQRIKRSVPKAHVVVTNPTHYAVALQYDRETMTAPTVVAKGRDFLALRIKEIALESDVPIVERKELARALYGSVEVGAEIPRDLFKAVAEVLAYVYKLKGKRAPSASAGRAS